MTYPNYPNNRLIVGGTDLTEKFKMVLADGYTLSPPQPKTYIVDIPGGNGKLDLTESLLGDVAYDNRSQEFIFYVIKAEDFERIKTNVSTFLHGKAFDYEITMDPGYTYHGRFTISSYEHGVYDVGKVGCIKISIDAEPFKYKKPQVYRISAVGGNIYKFPSGRKPVMPTIEADGRLRIIYNRKQITLYQGSWCVNDILFISGYNEVYFNSYDIRILTWDNVKYNGITWGKFKTRRIFEWYKSNGDSNIVVKTWDNLRSTPWNDLSTTTWADQMYTAEITDKIRDSYIKYDWGDL